MRKIYIFWILFFSYSLYAQVQFVLLSKTQNNFCKKSELQIKMLVTNYNNKEIWVYKDMYYSPTKHFYLMIKKEGETKFTKISFCFFHAVWQNWFFKLKPNENKEINILIHTSIFPKKYLDCGILSRMVRGFIFFLEKIVDIPMGWVDVCPLKPGKYELYFVYDLNVDPVKYKLHDVLLGTYETNHIYWEVPSCSFTEKMNFFKNSFNENKILIFTIFTICGIFLVVCILFFYLFWKLLKFVFRRKKFLRRPS